MQSKKKVFLIIRNRLIRKMIRLALTQPGQGICVVGEAKSGAEALTFLATQPCPAVILLDSGVHDGPARCLVQTLHARYPAARIIVLSDQPDMPIRKAYLKSWESHEHMPREL